jgi:hypothetical protein
MIPMNNKFSPVMAFAVVAGAILGAGGYYLISSFSANNSSSQIAPGDISPVSTTSSIMVGDSSTTTVATSSQASAPRPVDMSTWKTYSNYELGFSIQYPPDLTVDVSNPSALVLTFPSSYFVGSRETSSVSVEISSSCTMVPSQAVDLNGISFAKNYQNNVSTYYSDNNGVCYTLAYASDGASDATNVDDIANAMLSTFTFISTPAGENEATYSAQQSGQATTSVAATSTPVSIINVTTILPDPATIGGNIAINGSGFSGNDTVVWITNGSVRGVLWSGVPISDTLITASVRNQVCTQDVSVSGAPCPSYLIINSGVYTLSVTNQNGTTNPVYIRVQ